MVEAIPESGERVDVERKEARCRFLVPHHAQTTSTVRVAERRPIPNASHGASRCDVACS